MIKWSAYRYYPAKKLLGAFWFPRKVHIAKPWQYGEFEIDWDHRFQTEESCNEECQRRNKRFLINSQKGLEAIK